MLLDPRVAAAEYQRLHPNGWERADGEVYMFLATVGYVSAAEALANLALDAASYRWPRAVVRRAAHVIRMVTAT